MRLLASRVEVTLDTGKVLTFIKSEGDTIVVNQIDTQPTGTPYNTPQKIQYYSLILSEEKPVAGVQESGV